LGHAAEVGCVTEHLRQRDISLYDLAVGATAGLFNAAMTAVQVAENITEVIFRRGDFDGHDGLEENGVALAGTFLEADGAGELECQFAGVNGMVRTIDEGNLEINHWEASEYTGLHGANNTLFNSGNIFLRNGTTDDLVDELKAVSRFHRLDLEGTVTELTFTTGLTNVLALNLVDAAVKGFAVCNLRLADVGFNVELATHTVYDDLQVKLT